MRSELQEKLLANKKSTKQAFNFDLKLESEEEDDDDKLESEEEKVSEEAKQE